MLNINDHHSQETELQPNADTVPDGYTDDSRDRAEFEQWKRAGRLTTMIDASATPEPVEKDPGANQRRQGVTYQSAQNAGKTSRNDVTILHDKLVVVFRAAGIAWPKDSETSFHTVGEDDYDEDGVGDDQPRHAGELPTE